MIDLNYQLILASGSPRRKQLLEALGFTFEVRKPDIDERYPPELSKSEIALYLAKKKAAAMQPTLAPEELLITADTTVVCGEKLLEKAANAKEAREMLSQLSGKSHQVITGVCLTTAEKQQAFATTTEVHFHTLDGADIDYYIEKFSPYDKAGAYGIQEWIGMIGVAHLKGSFYNVMGLPVDQLYTCLKSF